MQQRLPGLPAASPQQTDDYEHGTPLETLVAWFDDAETDSRDARQKSERDRDYVDGKQLTKEEIETLKARGQPPVVINRIQPKIHYLLGWERSNRTDPRAFPRTPADEDASEAATDALRYVEDATDLKQMFSAAWENMLVEGAGAIELTVEPPLKEGADPEIEPVHWDWDRIFWDPHSRKHDYSDARYMGGVLWLDAEDAKEKWPDAAEQIDAMTTDQSLAGTTYDDRPKWVMRSNSSSSKRVRVRVVQMYHREGQKWVHCTFCKTVKLDAVEVPFVDQDGRSWCPFLIGAAFIDRENQRYGLVRSMIDAQDEINKRRSKALHRLAMRQVQSEKGAVDDVDHAKAQLAKPDGWIETNPSFAFNVLPGGEQLEAELTMLQEAKNEIELMGPNAAMLGRDGDAPSGRAILANQQSGQTEIALLLDRHRFLKKRVYQRIWDLIRQYKKAQWWVRVTDDERNVKFVGLNRPVTALEDWKARKEKEGIPPDEIEAILQQAQGDPAFAMAAEQVVRTENNPTEMHMDITIEEVPDSANVQMEQFEALTKLAPAVVFPPEVYLEASSLRNKKRLIELIKGGGQQDPAAAEAAKIELEQKVERGLAEISKIKADAEKARAEAAKTFLEADLMDGQMGVIQLPAVSGGTQQEPQQPEPQMPPQPVEPDPAMQQAF